MAGKTDPIRKQASREATDWLILLQDDPDDPELRDRFEAWLSASPSNVGAWEAIQRTSAAIGRATPGYADRWRPFLTEMRSDAAERSTATGPAGTRERRAAERPTDRRQVLRLGGLAVAASLLAVLVGPDLMMELKADYATGTAEIRTVNLDDDSLVTLAPESAIAVAYSAGERHVRLLAGEAYFDVVPNARRPFRVAARAVDVVVLGTGFDVRRGADGADVAVEHGSVRVDHATAAPPVAETLTAGQSVWVSWSGRAVRGSEPRSQIAAWRHNQLIAQDQPLGTVVDELRSYYVGRIVVMDEGLASRPITGVYNLTDPVEALRGIARAQNAVVRRITPWLLVVSAS